MSRYRYKSENSGQYGSLKLSGLYLVNVIIHLIDHIKSESSGCREACAFGLRDIIFRSITENIEDMEAVNLVHKYFTCLRQQATNDAELCSTTVKACSVGFTPEMTAELSSSDKGLKFMESSISILSAVIEYSKGMSNVLLQSLYII